MMFSVSTDTHKAIKQCFYKYEEIAAAAPLKKFNKMIYYNIRRLYVFYEKVIN